MDYLLDTNILLIYGRSAEIANRIEEDLNLFNGSHNLGISVVTLGELDSLTKQFNYGKRRITEIEKLLKGLFVIDINVKPIIERYGEIDAYSQGKLEGKSVEFSARNMGKNDLWIAATASYYDMNLVTADKDFQHLKNQYLSLTQINIENYKSK